MQPPGHDLEIGPFVMRGPSNLGYQESGVAKRRPSDSTTSRWVSVTLPPIRKASSEIKVLSPLSTRRVRCTDRCLGYSVDLMISAASDPSLSWNFAALPWLLTWTGAGSLFSFEKKKNRYPPMISAVGIQSGMFPCFFHGFSSVLLRSMASPRATRRRVARGMITSST